MMMGHRAELLFEDEVIKLSRDHCIIRKAIDSEQGLFKDNVIVLAVGSRIIMRDVGAKKLSRRQGIFIWQRDGYVYRNLGVNPASVDGKVIMIGKQIKLKNKDKIRIPEAEFVYLI